MKKILFFMEPEWVFGKIHNDLIKALHPELYCDFISWKVSRTKEHMLMFQNKYDLFVSTIEGCQVLHESYGLPTSKLVGVAHSYYDIYIVIKKDADREFFEKLAGYAVIWPNGQNISLAFGVKRIPEIIPIGLFTELYPKKQPTGLTNIGYFGKLERIDKKYDLDLKRGFLVEKIAKICDLEFNAVNDVSFLLADQLYYKPDVIVFSSLTEGNPYPALEGFASGIPVLGTNTGVFPEYVKNGGGEILPFEENDFVEKAVNKINFWKSNFEEYKNACCASFEIGQKIDWKFLRVKWIDYLSAIIEKQNVG